MKVLNQEQMMDALADMGVRVCGTSEEFSGRKGNGIWISAESTPDLFDYWSGFWADTFGIEPKLDEFVEKSGWYFEWHDAGTMMCWPN